MNPEQLLLPRYKVIADYPDGPFQIGDIILFQSFHLDPTVNAAYNDKGKFIAFESSFIEYPHLFKKLQWWEDRKPEDMEGVYIRVTADNPLKGCVYKIKQHFTSDGDKYHPAPYFTTEEDTDGWYYYTLNPEIITQAEYDAATNKP